MNKVLKSILVVGALVPFYASAAVNVTLHKDVEAIIINGEELPLTLMSKNTFSMENGTNQLVVRLSKLIATGSEFDKFKSDPLVITFSSENSDILIKSTRQIDRDAQVKGFKESPSFTLTDQSGNAVSSDQNVLPQGQGFLRDYEKELARFNKKQGVVLGGAALTASAVAHAGEASVPSNVQKPIESTVITPQKQVSIQPAQGVSPENSIILMQADFLRMNQEQQKQFLQWAVKNVRS
ncbi:YccT family protein [Enterovibrio norvegicus]|uniref:YccT family protein n=1 Tax=Enterovibrio norvegicus TaxID=188144 RepID=UPI00354F3B03